MSNAIHKGELVELDGKLAAAAKPGTLMKVTGDSNVVTGSNAGRGLADFAVAGANDGFRALYVLLPRFGQGGTKDETIPAGATVTGRRLMRGDVVQLRVDATAFADEAVVTASGSGQIKVHASGNAVLGEVAPGSGQTAARTAGDLVPILVA